MKTKENKLMKKTISQKNFTLVGDAACYQKCEHQASSTPSLPPRFGKVAGTRTKIKTSHRLLEFSHF